MIMFFAQIFFTHRKRDLGSQNVLMIMTLYRQSMQLLPSLRFVCNDYETLPQHQHVDLSLSKIHFQASEKF